MDRVGRHSESWLGWDGRSEGNGVKYWMSEEIEYRSNFMT